MSTIIWKNVHIHVTVQVFLCIPANLSLLMTSKRNMPSLSPAGTFDFLPLNEFKAHHRNLDMEL